MSLIIWEWKPTWPQKFYFRTKGTTGNNIDPAYSNVEAVTITPYELDMRFANVLDQNATATGMTLFSANTDGIYKGFVGVEGWFNFLVQEADGKSGEMTTRPECRSCSLQPATGSAGYGTAGCYYITFDTNSKQWNGLLIPSLNVSGDINAYHDIRPCTNRKWTATFNADATGTITVRIDGIR
ncbi:MAG: DUF5111 domain-containing protein [Bacteroides thetaiotaomicron]